MSSPIVRTYIRVYQFPEYAVSSARLATIQDTIRETSCPASAQRHTRGTLASPSTLRRDQRDHDRRSHPCSMRGETLISIELRAYFNCVQFNYSGDSAHIAVCVVYKKVENSYFRIFSQHFALGGEG